MAQGTVGAWTESSSDAELIAGVRAGDRAAFGMLYERHAAAARKVARQYTNSEADAEDVVSESFSRILRALGNGDGPDLAFRAYLFTIVRRTGLNLINAAHRTRPSDDETEIEQAMGAADSSDVTTMEGFEQTLVAGAFESLPERWRAVLWYTEVEKKTPREIAPLLGLSANGVSALAYRAREALRQAYLQQHLHTSTEASCREANEQLGAYVRGGLSKRENARVQAHVDGCERCALVVAELRDVNHGLRAVIAPLYLGLIGVGALAAGLPIGGGIVLGAVAGGTATGAATGVAAKGAAVGSGAASGASGSSSAGGGAGAAGGAATAGAGGIAIPAGIAAGVAAIGLVSAAAFGILPLPWDAPETVVAAEDAAPVEQPASQGSGTSGQTDEPAEDSEPADETPDEPAEDIAPAPVQDETPAPDTQRTGGSTSTTGTDQGTTEPGTTDPGPTDPGPTDPGPTDPGPTDPEPPVTEPAAIDLTMATTASWTADLIVLDAADPVIDLTLENSGEATATDLIATIALPAGLEIAPPAAVVPAGAGAGDHAAVASLFRYLATSEFDAGEWTCVADDATTASCTAPEVLAGGATTLSLPVVDIAGAATLAPDAFTSITVELHGEIVGSVSLPTAFQTGTTETLPTTVAAVGHYDVAQAGSTLLAPDGCVIAPPRTACDDLDGSPWINNGANDYDPTPLTVDATTVVSASTDLVIPEGARIESAVLEWSANTDETGFSGALDTARVMSPGAVEWTAVGAGTDYPATTVSFDAKKGGGIHEVYNTRVDITSLVAEHGGGSWSVADIALGVLDSGATGWGSWAGFSITVVYEDESLPVSRVLLYEGTLQTESMSASNGKAPVYQFGTARDAQVEVFLTAWDGDYQANGNGGDSVLLDGQQLVPVRWDGTAPAHATGLGPDGYCGSGQACTWAGDATSSAALGSWFANNLGVDAHPFEPASVTAGAHTLIPEVSGSDRYIAGTMAVLITPDVD